MSTSVSRRSPSAVHPTRQQLDDLDALLKRMLDLPVNRLEDDSDEDESSSQVEESVPLHVPEPIRGPHRQTLSRPQETPAAPPQYRTSASDEADLKPRVIIVAPNSPENETNSAALAPGQTTEQGPAAAQSEDWVPLTSSWRPSSRTWKPLTEAWQQAQGTNGLPPAAPTPPERPQQAQTAPVTEYYEEISQPVVELSPPPQVAPPIITRPTPPAPAPEGTPWHLLPLAGFNAAFDVCLEPWGPIGRWLRGPTGRALLGIFGLLFLTAALALAAADWIGWTS